MKGVKDKANGRFIKNIPIQKECIVCFNSFAPRHDVQQFCSAKCMGKSYTKDHTRNCVICRNNFSAKSMATRFCSQECYTTSGLRAKKGAENHLWKGGITPLNAQIRMSGKYKNFIKSILDRDNYTCAECQNRGAKLHVDHIIPFSAIIEKIKFQFGIENVLEQAMKDECLLWDTNNCRTLCVPCHKKTDSYLNINARNYGI